jgi:hypothetical protein
MHGSPGSAQIPSLKWRHDHGVALQVTVCVAKTGSTGRAAECSRSSVMIAFRTPGSRVNLGKPRVLPVAGAADRLPSRSSLNAAARAGWLVSVPDRQAAV